MTVSQPTPEEERAQEREARILELEDSLRKPRRPISATVAAAVLLLAAVMLWQGRHEVAYFLSPREPIVLGTEAGYRLDLLQSNRYVQLHGVPGRRAIFGSDGPSDFVIVALEGTPILVRRGRLAGEEWDGRGKPPPANVQPFSVGGRLLERADAPKAYAQAFEEFERNHDLGAYEGKQYLLLEGSRPENHLSSAVFALFLLGFGGFNARLLVRALRRRRR